MSIEDDVEDQDEDEEPVEEGTPEVSPFFGDLLLGLAGVELPDVPEQVGSTGLDDQFRRLVAKPRLRFRRRRYRRLG